MPTRAVFGDYISIYDTVTRVPRAFRIQRGVAGKATMPIHYESRLAKQEKAMRANLKGLG